LLLLDLPVDSLLKKLPKSYNSIRLTGYKTGTLARYLLIEYPDKTTLQIRASEYHFKNSADSNHLDDIDLYKMEKLEGILLEHPDRLSVCEETDPVFIFLRDLDFDKYLNKPIDSLLAVIPPSYIRLKIYGHSTNYRARILVVEYPNRVELEVRPKKFKIMPEWDERQLWDVDLFRKETAWYIDFYYLGLGIKEAMGD
jgi:hypothetical protein